MAEVKRCARCVMPVTWPNLTFDAEGVCAMCRAHEERQKWDWAEKARVFQGIVQTMKDSRLLNVKYHCVVGFSGGKDSTWVLYSAVKRFGLTPLAVTFDHGFDLDDVISHNLREVPKRLGVDHLTFTIGDDLRNKLIRLGMELLGDFCLHCHRGVGAYVPRTAMEKGIRFVLWGEPAWNVAYTEESGYGHFKRWFSCGLDEWSLPGHLNHIDALPMQWKGDPNELPKHCDVYLGDYEPWAQAEHADILERELGWRRQWRQRASMPNDWDKIDCPYEPLRDWQKVLKFGPEVTRAAFNLSKAVRDGMMTRQEAADALGRYDMGEPAVMMLSFTQDTGITGREFRELTLRKKGEAVP